MHVLITGATGFIGSSLVNTLLSYDYKITVLVRKNLSYLSSRINQQVCNIFETDTLSQFDFSDVDCIIHLAARVHVMREYSFDSLTEYRMFNRDVSIDLARVASNKGVGRFIYISSIKVNGELTPLGQPFAADDVVAPEDAYGISKWEAEQGINKIAVEAGMEVVIVRPPLVYGPNVKGNFATMINLVERGFPLPLGAIHNQRSLVALDNLIDLIITCIDHPAAANQVFLAGDGQDLSTTELLRGIAKAAGKPSKLIPIPSFLLMLAASLFGKKAVAQRLLGSLQVDISKARELLGWEPPISVEEGLRRCFSKD